MIYSQNYLFLQIRLFIIIMQSWSRNYSFMQIYPLNYSFFKIYSHDFSFLNRFHITILFADSPTKVFVYAVQNTFPKVFSQEKLPK